MKIKEFISNEDEENQRIHRSRIPNDKIINEIEYSEKIEIPEELIKFSSVNKNNTNALLNNFLWAANPDTFNDPFDCPIQTWAYR
jgi:hypothetical protein